MNCNSYILYRIFYDGNLVYVGRTTQELKDRLRLHFFSKPMVRKLNILSTSHIDYTVLPSEANMFLYEIYYINLWHPCMNVDDNARDCFTADIILPELTFYAFDDPILKKWKEKFIHNRIEQSSCVPLEDEVWW